jgi:hypothetical protein
MLKSSATNYWIEYRQYSLWSKHAKTLKTIVFLEHEKMGVLKSCYGNYVATSGYPRPSVTVRRPCIVLTLGSLAEKGGKKKKKKKRTLVPIWVSEPRLSGPGQTEKKKKKLSGPGQTKKKKSCPSVHRGPETHIGTSVSGPRFRDLDAQMHRQDN